MLANPRPRTLRSRGHLPHPLSSPRYAWTRAPPTRSSTSRNIEWDPQWTPLVAAASIWPSSSSAATDIDATREDGPTALLSSKPQTRAAKVCRSSSYTCTSHRAASSTLSCMVASTRRSASRAQLGCDPRSRSQILTAGHSSRECRSSIFWNLVAILLTTSTWKVSLGEHPSTNSTVVDTIMKCGKLSDHFSMAEGRKPHPLKQVMHHPWRTNDGMTQLGTPSLQKGDLLELFLALPLRHLLGLTLHCKLILKEGDLPGKGFDIFTSRGKCCVILRLYSQYPL
jgi:hypothetical protein